MGSARHYEIQAQLKRNYQVHPLRPYHPLIHFQTSFSGATIVLKPRHAHKQRWDDEQR